MKLVQMAQRNGRHIAGHVQVTPSGYTRSVGMLESILASKFGVSIETALPSQITFAAGTIARVLENDDIAREALRIANEMRVSNNLPVAKLEVTV